MKKYFNYFLIVIYMIIVIASIINIFIQFENKIDYEFLVTIITSLTTLGAFLILIINKVEPIKRYVNKILNYKHSFLLNFNVDIYPSKEILDLSVFNELRSELLDQGYTIIKFQKLSNTSMMIKIEKDKTLPIEMKIESNGDYFNVSFTNMTLNAKKIKKHIERYNTLIVLIIKNMAIKKHFYHVKLIFDSNVNPYLKYYLHNATDDIKSARIKLKDSVSLYNNKIEISTKTIDEMFNDIDKNVVDLRY